MNQILQYPSRDNSPGDGRPSGPKGFCATGAGRGRGIPGQIAQESAARSQAGNEAGSGTAASVEEGEGAAVPSPFRSLGGATNELVARLIDKHARRIIEGEQSFERPQVRRPGGLR